jgi:hypothetical protein
MKIYKDKKGILVIKGEENERYFGEFKIDKNIGKYKIEGVAGVAGVEGIEGEEEIQYSLKLELLYFWYELKYLGYEFKNFWKNICKLIKN